MGSRSGGYLLWEQDRKIPKVSYYPRLFAFLGYDPFPPPRSLGERLLAKRRELGLSIERAAGLLGVDEATFRKWERGTAKPLVHGEKIGHFLARGAVAAARRLAGYGRSLLGQPTLG